MNLRKLIPQNTQMIAVTIIALLSGIIVILQFKHMNGRLYRLERSVTNLTQEWTNSHLQQLKQSPEVNVATPNNAVSSGDNQIQQLQSEYQEYDFTHPSEDVTLEQKAEETEANDTEATSDKSEQEENDNNESTTRSIEETETPMEELNLSGKVAMAAINRQNGGLLEEEESLELESTDLQEIEQVEKEDLQNLTVNRLKELIKEKGGTIPRKVVKADLVQIYQEL